MVVSKREIRYYDLEEIELRVKDDDPESRTITGYAARFDKLSVDLGGFREKIQRGAFTRSLKEGRVMYLWNHNRDIVLASSKSGTLRLWEDDKGLRFEADVPDSAWGNSALESVRRKDVDGMSFGFGTPKNGDRWEEQDKQVTRTLVDVTLFEISSTAFPAYPSTSAGVRSTEEVLAEYRSSQPNTDDEETRRQAREAEDELNLLFDVVMKTT
jgi:HK97 family phage prohead protease